MYGKAYANAGWTGNIDCLNVRLTDTVPFRRTVEYVALCQKRVARSSLGGAIFDEFDTLVTGAMFSYHRNFERGRFYDVLL